MKYCETEEDTARVNKLDKIGEEKRQRISLDNRKEMGIKNWKEIWQDIRIKKGK